MSNTGFAPVDGSPVESRPVITLISGSSPEPLGSQAAWPGRGITPGRYAPRSTDVYGTHTGPIDETVCIASAQEIGLAADLF